VDPPYHFDDTGPSVDELSLDIMVGKAWMCDLGSKHEIDVTDLQDCVPDATQRLLLKTTNSDLWRRGVQEFVSDFVVITPDAARWIVKRGIRLLGVDYLSVERPGAPGHPVHHALLGAGVIVVEGLDLSLLEAGWYNLYCLPLRVAGGDGAPARAVAVGPLR
jgi:arylformamidase